MQTEKIAGISLELLSSLHYSNIEEAGLDMLLLSAQSKYSEFSNEARFFENKYHMKFAEFQKMVEKKVEDEDFEQEDDLMTWKFAHESAQYWKKKVEELKSCC